MRADAIVIKLLEDEPEDPKDFVQRDPVLALDAYFGPENSKVVSTRHPNNPAIAAYFEASCNETDKRCFIGIQWGIENTDNYADLGRGGMGQVFIFSTLRDVHQFMADLTALELAVTAKFDAHKAREINQKIGSRTAYSRPYGYSDPRGRS